MKKVRSKRQAGDKARAVKGTKRLKQIQSVFERLGIGSDDERQRARSIYSPVAEERVHYRITLAGSTIV